MKKTKIGTEYDVIVAGSGPSGMAAAVMAGRMGAKTLLIEWQGSVGGISTGGLMSHFTGTVDSRLYREVLNRQAKHSLFSKGSASEEPTVVIDPELLKIVYLEMLKEAGVDLLLYTFVSDVLVDENDENRICGVITEGKSGRVAYKAKVVVDATGDGDVAYLAGAEYFKGRESDGAMQPATLMFKIGGVDTDRAIFPGSFETEIAVPQGEIQALARKHLPPPTGHALMYQSTLPGIVTLNMTNCIGIDGTKSEDLTRAEVICRAQMEPIVEFLRQYAPGYENCYIISAASLIGIRETRHFIGEQTLTEKDILDARVFEDWVVKGAHFNFDVHNLTGAGLDKTGCQHEFKQAKGYTIPFGCMVPKKMDGLLLSGRNISGTHKAHSNFRAMPICLAIGEADGIAAALAARSGRRVREIRAEEIQKEL